MEGLQNHPGEREFPVRVHWRYHRRVRDARRIRQALPDRWRTTLIVVIVLAAWAALAPLALHAIRAPETPLLLGVIAAAIAIAVFVPLAFTAADTRLPRREQRRYRRAGRMKPLTKAQQRLLALDALSDYSSGSWNSSLEYLPCAVRLKGTGLRSTSFLTLEIITRDQATAMLDTLVGAASEWQLRRVLEDLMKGEISTQFRDALTDRRQTRRMEGVAARAGMDVAGLRQLATKSGPAPAPQLRGMDVNRIVQAVRLGYMAGFLPEEEAWELLARVGQACKAHFPTMEAYVDNMRVAAAFLDDSPAAVTDFDAMRAGLLASDWPAAKILAPAEGDPARVAVREE